MSGVFSTAADSDHERSGQSNSHLSYDAALS
jgi:hypothetical protein